MKKYEYMVIYSLNNGIGRIRIISEKFIKSYDDIERIDEIIRGYKGMETALVINFKFIYSFSSKI